MSYLMQAKCAQDADLMVRITACVASEGVESPQQWVAVRNWVLSAQPGWAAAYASAKLAYEQAPEGEGIPPGENEAAITDGMILSSVQLLIAEETVEP